MAEKSSFMGKKSSFKGKNRVLSFLVKSSSLKTHKKKPDIVLWKSNQNLQGCSNFKMEMISFFPLNFQFSLNFFLKAVKTIKMLNKWLPYITITSILFVFIDAGEDTMMKVWAIFWRHFQLRNVTYFPAFLIIPYDFRLILGL